jgi:hypothetical protein
MVEVCVERVHGSAVPEKVFMRGQDIPTTDPPSQGYGRADWDCKSQPLGSWAVDEFVEVEEGGADHGVGRFFAAGAFEVAAERGC